MLIRLDDGTRYRAISTNGEMWLSGANEEETPVPPPPPPSQARFIWPFSLDLVTSEYGPRRGRLHAGIDFGNGAANVEGNPIRASSSGKVYVAGVHGGYGNTVILDHGQGLFTLYGHMSPGTMAVSVGQTVTQNQNLGGIGHSGQSRGNHLHFETHEGGYRWNASSRDPRQFIPKWNAA